MAQRSEGETSNVQGGLHTPSQSRLVGYMSPSSAGHRSLPQSYPADQHFIQSFSQNNLPPLQPLYTTHESSPSFGSIGEGAHASLAPSHFLPTSYLQLPSPSSQANSPQHVPQDRSRQFSPPPMSYTHPALQTTSHPQIPGSQTLLPSITTLPVDTATHDSILRHSRSPVCHTVPSAQSPGSDSNADDLKPLPQNLRGDPFRSAKVKTELCRYYKTPKGCIFGDKCNYAHGEEDLKFNKLMDLEAAGLLDVEVFRCHACPTWIATGAW